MEETLRQQIIEELSLTNESPEMIDEVIATIGELILQTVIIKVTENLDDDLVVVFEKIISSDDETSKQEQISQFLAEHVPHLEEVVAESSKEVIEEYKKLGDSN